jgi:hypothetical protein
MVCSRGVKLSFVGSKIFYKSSKGTHSKSSFFELNSGANVECVSSNIVSFACYDDTSISFLKNMFGSSCAEMVPNLKKLQAVVFGKVVKSERPVVVEIPYDENKV